jgi:predicted dehydrogenase
MNRRNFVSSTLAGLAGAAALSGLKSARAAGEPKLQVALIGCGWYGMVDVEAAFKVGGVEVVAVCDVDSDHLEQSAAKIEKLQGRRPKTFKRYQELLQVQGLQALILATPPHWHALPFLAALDRGLDIYCEKPLAYDPREGRVMADAARKSDRIVQVGFQRRQSPALQQARQYVRDGNAGRIVQVEAQIFYTAGLKDTTPQDPPASLDWDLWCGPAPKLPYSPNIGHFAWRLEQAYGHGHLVDWGIHLIDATRWMLGETMPRRVQAAGGIYHFKDKITTPDVLTVQFDFATCPVIWRHRIWGAVEHAPEVENGIFFYGEKETVFATDGKWMVIPKDRKAERRVVEVGADMGTLHMAAFLESVRTRRPPTVTVEDAHASTATVQLGAIAYETGTRVQWDPSSEQVADNPAASALLRRAYRGPWRHPHAG